jgi:hypothetical protein
MKADLVLTRRNQLSPRRDPDATLMVIDKEVRAFRGHEGESLKRPSCHDFKSNRSGYEDRADRKPARQSKGVKENLAVILPRCPMPLKLKGDRLNVVRVSEDQ